MNETSLQKKIEDGRYYYSADILRLGSILCLILTRYGIPLYSGLVTPFLNFAPGTLFLLYGYFVLRDGTDLKKNIKNTAKVFGIMLAVCFVLATVYMWLVYGTPFAYLTKRGIFNFVVLNYWGPSMGDYIWMVQSTLYALIVCYLFRKLKRFDVIFCILLFVISFLIGEGAGFLGFNVLGYTFIPGNFFTRTLPYMLLGRIMYHYKSKLTSWKQPVYCILIAVGFALCTAEMIGFSMLGKLVYYGHLTGFILISFGLMGLVMKKRRFGKKFVINHMELYKKMYFLYNPVREILMVLFSMLVTTQEGYVAANMFAGVLVCTITFMLALGWEKGMEVIEGVRKQKGKSYAE